MNLFNQLSRRIGIDLGSTRTRIWHDQHGFMLDEATCLAVDERVSKVVAIGDEAAAMKGRAPEHIKIYYPIKNGVVDDPAIAQAFLRTILQKVITYTYFFRPVIMASITSVADDIDRQTLTDLLYTVGAREVYLISQPLAAAIGAEIPIADASGSFVLHLGGGVVEGGIISFGSLVAAEGITQAGQYADELIQKYLEQEKSLLISLRVAEVIKQKLSSCGERKAEKLISGQDILTTAPKEVLIDAKLVSQALKSLATNYADLMKRVIEKIPPELTSDVIDKGMLLTGSWAKWHGLDSYLVKELGISVSVVEEPNKVVIKGVATALKHLDLFKESLGYE
jgi:rod shape-determining protein MreB